MKKNVGWATIKQCKKFDLPCWCVGRLVELLPDGSIIHKSEGIWVVSFDIDECHSRQFSGDSMAGVVCEAVEWCLESGIIESIKI